MRTAPCANEIGVPRDLAPTKSERRELSTQAKMWEIRGTSWRDRIGLIKTGTGTVLGIANVVGVVGPLAFAGFVANAHKAVYNLPIRNRMRRTNSATPTNPPPPTGP